MTQKLRPSYKALPELPNPAPEYITYDQLAKEMLLTKLQIAVAFREANFEPFARKFEFDAETGKKKPGAPTLCFEPQAAKGAVLAKYTKKAPAQEQ